MLKDTLTPQKLADELKHSNLSKIAKKYGVSRQYMTQLHTEYRAAYPELFPEKTVSKEWLEHALETKTIIEICNDAGLSYYHIRNLIRNYQIPKKYTTTSKFDEEKIRRQYIDLWWSDREIAAEYGCSVSLVKKFRYDHGILKTDRLPLTQRLTKSILQTLINEYHLTASEICYIFDATPNEIQKFLSYYNLSPSSANRNLSPNKEELSIIKANISSLFVEP